MRIGVVGAGAWGTALAQLAAAKGEAVLIWAREDAVAEAINSSHENTVFLAGVALSPSITATTDAGGLHGCDALLVVAPAQHLGAVLASIDVGTRPLVLCAKGIEGSTGRLMSEVARTAHPQAPRRTLRRRPHRHPRHPRSRPLAARPRRRARARGGGQGVSGSVVRL